jgi:transposase
MGAGRKPPSYNVQAAVDVETSLIVHHEVTTEPTDNRLLAGRTLVRKQVLTRKRSILYVAEDCLDCALKPRCTRVERRFVRRHLYEDALERMNARVEADPGLMRQRRCAAEHPFGTIKRMTAGGRFLTRGLNKVKAETALSVLAYNILRAINLVGASGLRASLA